MGISPFVWENMVNVVGTRRVDHVLESVDHYYGDDWLVMNMHDPNCVVKGRIFSALGYGKTRVHGSIDALQVLFAIWRWDVRRRRYFEEPRKPDRPSRARGATTADAGCVAELTSSEPRRRRTLWEQVVARVPRDECATLELLYGADFLRAHRRVMSAVHECHRLADPLSHPLPTRPFADERLPLVRFYMGMKSEIRSGLKVLRGIRQLTQTLEAEP